MKIGIIGAGEVATIIAAYAADAGHAVALSSQSGPSSDKLQKTIKELGPSATAVTVEEAAARHVVILAVPWSQVEAALSGLPEWGGRILIDATNPFLKTGSKPQMADLGEQGASEVVAALAPGARVVKAFNNTMMKNFAMGPGYSQARRVLFVSGDDATAKDKVTSLIGSFGFTSVDLGDLKTGGRMQEAGRGPLAGHDFLVLES